MGGGDSLLLGVAVRGKLRKPGSALHRVHNSIVVGGGYGVSGVLILLAPTREAVLATSHVL